jgi:hypothetical protein
MPRLPAPLPPIHALGRDRRPAADAARRIVGRRLGSADHRAPLARATRRRPSARYRPAPAVDRPRRLRRRRPGLGRTGGCAGVRRSRERRGRDRLRTAQPAGAHRPDARRRRRPARSSRYARSSGTGGVRGELGRRDLLPGLVRHRPRADRALASPAADPPRRRSARPHDPGALSPGARRLHARPALRLPARRGGRRNARRVPGRGRRRRHRGAWYAPGGGGS